jgi:hypothetical protein
VLSHQDGCHSAVALLLKAALIQVSDYRLLGASGNVLLVNNIWTKKNHQKHRQYPFKNIAKILFT